MKSNNRGPPKFTFNTAKATGYNDHTVRRYVTEKSEISGTTFTSPAKRYKIGIILGDFDTEALRRLVHDFYWEKKFPTLDTVLVAAKEKGIAQFSGVLMLERLCCM